MGDFIRSSSLDLERGGTNEEARARIVSDIASIIQNLQPGEMIIVERVSDETSTAWYRVTYTDRLRRD